MAQHGIMTTETRMDRLEWALERLAEAQARSEERLSEAQAWSEQRGDRLERALERLSEAQAWSEQRGDRLERALERMSEAQARADARFEELSEAQAWSEQRGDRLERALERLSEAQTRTEERMSDLERAVDRLATRTDERVSSLERAMERLAEAQARTDESVGRLARGLDALRGEVGRLGEQFGFTLEDIARTVLPGYLQRHHGLDLEGPLGDELRRRFFDVDGEPVKVDLYGEGWRNGQRAVVLGESKARIFGREVERFGRALARVKPLVKGEIWRVMFGYYIHPTAMEAAQERDILLVASYQR